MLDMKAGTFQILFYVGCISLIIEYFAIFYVAPYPGQAKVAYHPILQYLGNQEGMIGSMIVTSILLISISAAYLKSKTKIRSVYGTGLIMAVSGIGLLLYGFLNSVPIATQFGVIDLQPYALRGTSLLFGGICLVVFISMFAHYVSRDSQRLAHI